MSGCNLARDHSAESTRRSGPMRFFVSNQLTLSSRFLFTRYRILQGETLVGRFYTDQLQPAVYSDEDTFKIEKILKSRKLKGRPKEYLVKWMLWPAKFNSWVSETQVEDIKKKLEEPHQKKKKKN